MGQAFQVNQRSNKQMISIVTKEPNLKLENFDPRNLDTMAQLNLDDYLYNMCCELSREYNEKIIDIRMYVFKAMFEHMFIDPKSKDLFILVNLPELEETSDELIEDDIYMSEDDEDEERRPDYFVCRIPKMCWVDGEINTKLMYTQH